MLLIGLEKEVKISYSFDTLEKGLVVSAAYFSHLKSVSVTKKIINF